MRRIRAALAFAGSTLLALGCGSDGVTGPNVDAALTAAVGSQPSSFIVAPLSDVRISLSWQDNSPNEEGFEIHRSAGGPTGTFSRIATTAANAVSYQDAGLQRSTEYCYMVRAVRTNGAKAAYSPFSSVACTTTLGPPPAPTAVTASPRELGMVLVSWTPVPTATGQRVERGPAVTGPWQGLPSFAGATSLMDNAGVPEQLICYRVVSVNQYGESASSPVCTTPPAPPTNTSVTAPAGGGLDVHWTDASAVEQGYEVQRAGESFQFATIAVRPANTTSYHDTSVALDTRYWYRVRATKDGGYTAFSPAADGLSASVPPDAPSDVHVLPNSSSTASISWASNSENGSGFRIERAVNGGSWVGVVTLGWAQSQFSDEGLTGDAEVCYRVIAFNTKGDSPASPADCARLLKGPTDFTGVAVGSSSVTLTWTDQSGFETGYMVQRIECYSYGYYYYDYCSITETTTLPAGTQGFTATGLTPGQSYTYVVYAIGTKDGEIYYSDPSQVEIATSP